MKLIYLNDDFDSTVDRILNDDELENCELVKDGVEKTIKSFLGDEIASSVFLKKYALRDGSNKILEYTLEEAKDRWAKSIMEGDSKFSNSKNVEYFRELYNYLLPAGRQMFALGNKYVNNVTFSNCYVEGIADDSIESIFNTARNMAKTYSYGGGVGLCLGKLRPRRAKVSNSSKFSTGAVSFMKLYSTTTNLIGQCVAEGQRVLTSSGLKNIENIKINDYVWTRYGFKKVTKTFKNGKKDIYKIRDNYGFELQVSKDHIVATELDGCVREKRIRELNIGDNVILLPGTQINKKYQELNPLPYPKKNFDNNRLNENVNIPKELDEKLAYFLGYSYGDGYIEYDKFEEPVGISVACSNDWPKIKNKLKNYIKDIFDYDVVISEGDGDLENFSIFSKKILFFLKNNNILKQKSHKLIFPDEIKKSSTSVQMAFISGFFDADGKKISSKKGYCVSITSKDFLDQIKIILMANGIVSKNHYENRKNLHWLDLYSISIAGSSSQTLANKLLNESIKVEEANFISKRDSYLTPFTSKSFSINYNKFNYINNDNYLSGGAFNKLKKVKAIDNNENIMIKSLIEDISYVGNLPTYDIQLENEHMYFCEGFYIHNSGRRGALMLSLPIDHPDIEEFIEIKHNNVDKIKNANISIKITDKFMRAVENDEYFNLEFSTKHEIIRKTVNAKELWNKIIKSARDSAEPGILFFDTAKKMSPSDTYDILRISTTNPCITGDTLVYVADGRGSISIKQLSDENKDIPVFCLNNEGKIVIRQMRHPRITGYNQPIYKVNFDDGTCVRTTSNHKFRLLSGEYKRVDELSSGDSLKIVNRYENQLINKYGKLSYKVSNGFGKYIDEPIVDKISEECNYVVKNNKVYVIKKCEICNKNFEVCYNRREIKLCSKKCVSKYKSTNNAEKQVKLFSELKFKLARNPLKKEWEGECKKNNISCKINTNFKTYEDLNNAAFDYNHKVVSVEFCGYDTVYNGTVDEFHNFFIGGFETQTKSGKKWCYFNNLNCGEIWLSAGENNGGGACVLSSLILYNFVENPFSKDAEFNFELFEEMIERGVRHLDNIVEMNYGRHALEGQNKISRLGRRIGLGITGLADMLVSLNLKYDSEEALKFVDKLMKFKMEAEYNASINLAKERGSFPIYDSNKHFTRGFCADLPEEIINKAKQFGLRNVSISTIAPSGSLSIIAQCSSGCEPIYALSYNRKVMLGEKDFKEFLVRHQGVTRFFNYTSDENLSNIWITAHDVDYKNRIQMQSILQKYVDSSISSTINLSKDITTDTVAKIYMEAWKSNLKGITVYRDGSREGILTINNNEDKFSKSIDSIIHCVKAEKGDKFYITISYENKDIRKPYQVFVNNYKRSDTDSFIKIGNVLIKMLLDKGVSYERVLKYINRSTNSLVKLTRFLSLSMKTDNLESAVEILDQYGFAGTLASNLYKILSKSIDAKSFSCPNCGNSNVKMEEGCVVCLDCSWSGCN